MQRAAEIHRRLAEGYPLILKGETEELLALIDPDIVDHRGGVQGDHVGKAAWKEKWDGMAARDETGFRDVSVTIEQNVEAGDISVNRYASRGTHSASGRSYEVLGMDMVRVRDGRVVEHWAVRDSDAIRHQLGQ
ncbi:MULTISPECIES: ester cyclase [Thermomonosporaceae]|uniref:ester cyclase n=1 Tax=Thermomonosporaceae TaxID=2012 RepID=UPI00255AD7D2|nr:MULTISPECIES: nuclear transport factor 2 family protein [Thermomonosporaceae]MDL4777631.1 ester cyclase [Actinomadura xylanilytica]